MSLAKGIEGDYLESKGNGLIFDVKGLLHPRDRKICFLRFYEDPTGDRIKEGKRFKKVYDLNERFIFLKKHFPQYVFYSHELDLEVQGLKTEDIHQIYTPREYFQNLCKKKIDDTTEQISKELCELFIEKGGVRGESIGITGSQMVGLSKDNSDIDLIAYGTKNSLNFHAKLKNILQESKDCRLYNLEEYKPHYNWRAGGSSVSFEDFLKSETRKLHQGKFKNVDFFVRFIKDPEDWGGDYYDYKYSNYGRIRLKAKILDDTDSIFTPCSYKIKPLKLIEHSPSIKNFDLNEIDSINSFRGRFCEHAKTGENVIVEGKLEKVRYKNETDYFRVLLADQMQDIMVVLDD